MIVATKPLGCLVGLIVLFAQWAWAADAQAQLLRRFFESPTATDKTAGPTANAAKQSASTAQANKSGIPQARPEPSPARNAANYPPPAGKSSQPTPPNTINRNVNPYSTNRGSANGSNAYSRNYTNPSVAKQNRPLPAQSTQLQQNRPGGRPPIPNPAQRSIADAYFGSQKSLPPPNQSSFSHGPVQQPAKSSTAGVTENSSPSTTDSRDSTSQLAPLEGTGLQAPVKPLDLALVQQRFGMTFDKAANQLIVDRLDANGNAQSAGLKSGDTIVEVGGAPITNPAELAEIAGLLSEGDQIELTIQRDGQAQKLLTQYGKSPEAPASELTIGEASNADIAAGSGWVSSNSDADLRQLIDEQRDMISRLQQRIRELEEAQKGSRSSF